jgi:Xaa-Pro dipeptidase
LSRIERFEAALREAGLAGALVMHPVSVYYLAGTGQPANLLVVPGREPVLYVRRYIELVRESSRVGDVRPGAGFSAIDVSWDGPLGMELDVLPASLVASARRRLGEIGDCSPALWSVREVKDASEVESMRASVALFDVLHAAMLEHLRPGITELELSAEIARALRLAGHHGVVMQRRWDAKLQMEGSVVSGPNLTTISRGPVTITGVGLGESFAMGASRREIAYGDLVNVDLGLNRDGYHADMARTYAVGEVSASVEDLARKCREIEDVAVAAIRPGVSCESVYEAARDAAERLGVGDIFQGGGPYIGHSIGLELDEPPVLGPGASTPIREGMILTIEPKLMADGGVAVNIEDDVVVTADGCEVLGSLPRSAFVVADDGTATTVPATAQA